MFFELWTEGKRGNGGVWKDLRLQGWREHTWSIRQRSAAGIGYGPAGWVGGLVVVLANCGGPQS